MTLFHRSTRNVRLTHEGALFLPRAKSILGDLRDAEHVVMGSGAVPQGELYITAPVLYGRLHVLPVAAKLLHRFAGLSVRMMLLDRNVRIVEEGIDVAVRIGQIEDSALRCVRIGHVQQTIVASPAYLEKNGTPRKIEELVKYECIVGAGIRTSNVWKFGDDGRREVRIEPRFTINGIEGQIAAACADLGLTNLLDYQVKEALAGGHLVSVLDDMQPDPVPVSLLFDGNRAAMPALRAFIDEIKLG